MQDLTVLGNAAAVPVIIFLTQLLKNKFNFFRGSDVLALLLSLVVCASWKIYNITPEIMHNLSIGFIEQFRFGIDMLITSFATWLAASKIYDLGHGEKKNTRVVTLQRKQLESKIEQLKKGNLQENKNEENMEYSEISDKLRNILEGK